MVSIGDLINKDMVNVQADDDMEFCLAVTAEWDNIVESVKYH